MDGSKRERDVQRKRDVYVCFFASFRQAHTESVSDFQIQNADHVFYATPRTNCVVRKKNLILLATVSFFVFLNHLLF